MDPSEELDNVVPLLDQIVDDVRNLNIEKTRHTWQYIETLHFKYDHAKVVSRVPKDLTYATICNEQIVTSGRGMFVYRVWNNDLQQDITLTTPPCYLGDVCAAAAEFTLFCGAPYPGKSTTWIEASERTFLCYEMSDTHHVIIDSLYEGTARETVEIWLSILQQPDFPLIDWYARKRGLDNGVLASEWPSDNKCKMPAVYRS